MAAMTEREDLLARMHAAASLVEDDELLRVVTGLENMTAPRRYRCATTQETVENVTLAVHSPESL